MPSYALRLFLFILCTAYLMVLASCAADPAMRSPSVSSAPAALTATDVADLFNRASASVSGLHVVQRTFENGRPSLTAESWMTRDSVRTEVSDDGRLVYLFTVRGQHAQEYVPAGALADGTRGPRFEDSTVSRLGWIDSPRLVAVSWVCHVGDQCGTWLGEHSRMCATLTPRLSTSTLLGIAEVEGASCAVIRWDWEPETPDSANTFSQGATYYVDLATGWLRRTEHYQAEAGRRMERVSLYRIEAAEPAAAVFELSRE
jgi:hypothetical protein